MGERSGKGLGKPRTEEGKARERQRMRKGEIEGKSGQRKMKARHDKKKGGMEGWAEEDEGEAGEGNRAAD